MRDCHENVVWFGLLQVLIVCWFVAASADPMFPVDVASTPEFLFSGNSCFLIQSRLAACRKS